MVLASQKGHPRGDIDIEKTLSHWRGNFFDLPKSSALRYRSRLSYGLLAQVLFSTLKTRIAVVAAGLSSHAPVCFTKTARLRNVTMFSLHDGPGRDSIIDTPGKHLTASEIMSDVVYKIYKAHERKTPASCLKLAVEETIARFRP
jgi:hypothetical protein